MNKYTNKYKYLPIIFAFITANFQPVQFIGLNNNAANANEIGVYSDALVAKNNAPALASAAKIAKNTPKITKILITAYSSSPDETDSTPFIAASGNHVRNGVAAANFLPFGARFRLPELFGEQVFIIEDRMHERFNDRIDIWFSTKEEAKSFGKKLAKVEIL